MNPAIVPLDSTRFDEFSFDISSSLGKSSLMRLIAESGFLSLPSPSLSSLSLSWPCQERNTAEFLISSLILNWSNLVAHFSIELRLNFISRVAFSKRRFVLDWRRQVQTRFLIFGKIKCFQCKEIPIPCSSTRYKYSFDTPRLFL